MTVREILTKIDLRCNKSASQDYDNIWKYQVKEAYYKEALGLIRSLIKGKTNTQEGDEESTSRVDDLQFLLTPAELKSKNKGNFNQSDKLPDDYLHFKRVTPVVSNESCSGIELRSDLREEANVDILKDLPSLEFEETFHTLIGNRVHLYHFNKFKVNNIKLVYYRKPKKVTFQDLNEVIEFKDDVCEVLVDKIAGLLNSDMENLNQTQLAQQRTDIII